METGPALSARRITKELNHLLANPIPCCSAGPIGDNIYHWRAIMKGPPDTPYEGGTFLLDLEFPIEYPFKPPDVRFLTKIYNPKVDCRGNVGIDLLRSKWSALHTIYDVLGEITLIMYQKQVRGTETEINNFERIARFWTLKYAQ